MVIIVSEERAGFIFYFQFDDQRYFISMPSTCSNGIQGCRRRFGSVQDSGCMTTIARGMSQGTLVWFKSFFHIQNVVVFSMIRCRSISTKEGSGATCTRNFFEFFSSKQVIFLWSS